MRRSREGEVVVFVVNATPVVRHDYRLGVPHTGFYREIINTDAQTYGGSNVGNYGGVQSEDRPWMARGYSILIHLVPRRRWRLNWKRNAYSKPGACGLILGSTGC